jgi:N6-L-threonylcarbamoyladenine synthase
MPQQLMTTDSCYILAIESSCDDTSCAVLQNDHVLSNVVAGQKVHEQYGGVVPELASRAHQSNIIPVVDSALRQAKIDKKQLNAIAFTQGPGLMGSLLVGSSFAKSMAWSLNIPLIAVHHMQAHILAHFIDHGQGKPQFPFLALTISGGHTQIVRVDNYHDMNVIGSTMDDAAGEAFDKSGKILGLNYPAGPMIDTLARKGNPAAFNFPIPKAPNLDYSFSGFKTSVLYFIQKQVRKYPDFIQQNLEDLCASIQFTIIEILFQKLERAVSQTGIKQVAIGGGVSANSGVRERLNAKQAEGWRVYIPPFEYTTDNAAMIGISAYYKYLDSDFANLEITSTPRISM